jgi:hypothetical protein
MTPRISKVDGHVSPVIEEQVTRTAALVPGENKRRRQTKAPDLHSGAGEDRLSISKEAVAQQGDKAALLKPSSHRSAPVDEQCGDSQIDLKA